MAGKKLPRQIKARSKVIGSELTLHTSLKIELQWSPQRQTQSLGPDDTLPLPHILLSPSDTERRGGG